MKVNDLAALLGASVLTEGSDPEAEITCGYTCDLLSWVLAHGEKGMAWTTVQTHVNVVAIAVLMDMACVVFAEGNQPEPATLEKAKTEGLALLATDRTAYEVGSLLYGAGVKPSKR
jgi:hypothetical protein